MIKQQEETMKKKYYFGIAVSTIIATLLLTGCEQYKEEKTSAYKTPTVNSDISTNSNNESKFNYAEKLKSEGYSTEAIESSESFVNRVLLQLNEIETFNSINTEPAVLGNNNADDSAKYLELLSKFDEEKAIYYLVKLSSDFNSLEDALNEYLIALQSAIDIDAYFKDKELYNASKNKKTPGTNSNNFISVRDIEEKALGSLQNMNNSNKNTNQLLPDISNPNQNLVPNAMNPQPDLPKVEIPIPNNPSREINDKLSPKY